MRGTSQEFNMRGPIILYHTPTSGHVSKIHLWIAASDRLFNSFYLKRKQFYCEIRFYACLTVGAYQLLAQLALTSKNWPVRKSHMYFFSSGHISFTPSRIVIPISFIISEETFTPWVCIFIDPCEEGLFNFWMHSLRQRWGDYLSSSCKLFRLAQDKIILTIRLPEDNPDNENEDYLILRIILKIILDNPKIILRCRNFS